MVADLAWHQSCRDAAIPAVAVLSPFPPLRTPAVAVDSEEFDSHTLFDSQLILEVVNGSMNGPLILAASLVEELPFDWKIQFQGCCQNNRSYKFSLYRTCIKFNQLVSKVTISCYYRLTTNVCVPVAIASRIRKQDEARKKN